jgi:hypothetical protein
MAYLGAWGTLIYEKNLMSKISCQTPFKIKRENQTSSSKRLFKNIREKENALARYGMV